MRGPEATDEMIKYLIDNPRIGRDRFSRKFAVGLGTAHRIISEVRGIKPIVQPSDSKKVSELSNTIDASDFIASHDIPKKIREALPQLKGKVITDQNLRINLGVEPGRWSRARMLDEFQPYQLLYKNQIYWMLPETAEEVRKKVDIL